MTIDEPEPIADLVSRQAIRFQAATGRSVAGTRVSISERLFQDRQGNWKIGKRDRAIWTSRMAETLMYPDEIWMASR